MIMPLAVILSFQLVGEVTSHALDLPLPGPVVGLCLLVAACLIRPGLADQLRPVTAGLLQHLSLFFVPAGVGVIAHMTVIREHGFALAMAIAGSTVLAIAAGALVFTAVARLTRSDGPDPGDPDA